MTDRGLPTGDSDEGLIDSFSFVLSFLRDIGLAETERTLVGEIGDKFPELKQPAEQEEGLQDRDHAGEEGEDDASAKRSPLRCVLLVTPCNTHFEIHR